MDIQRPMLDELKIAGLPLIFTAWSLMICENGEYFDGNFLAKERKWYKEIAWDSREVCAYYFARICSYDLFLETKSDLGGTWLEQHGSNGKWLR
ncbi:hypothetical protein K2173_008622 [Erythroxylum novogranatense]|uniref:Uncharacterized protein n=1 Tax=Erythroxylum novogranatense TaxID=1862640 RepID=A0AAV8SKT7_9ROSI|nr:hypothetical protein K2173_008622 [Erythroxylum novogranatense]